MFIDDRFLKCVTFLEVRNAATGEFSIRGTAFWLCVPVPGMQQAERPDGTSVGPVHTYLATARHNLEKARVLGVEHLFARVNSRKGGIDHVALPLSSFFFHPDPNVDVCIASPPPVAEHDVLFWSNEQFISQAELAEVGPGTRVAIVGLFGKHTGTSRNVPIVRTGHIAAMPGEPVATRMGPMEAYLVEAYSVGGLSGSPVFVDIRGGTRRRLLGLVHGHFDEAVDPPGSVNAGIGVIVPCSKISEILATPEAEFERRTLRSA